jgi:ABC-type transport system substrate-binding protein
MEPEGGRVNVWTWLGLLVGGHAVPDPTFYEDGPLIMLDPLYAVTAGDERAASLVYDRILTQGLDGALTSRVLEDWDVESDGRITLRLKSGLRWHDGEPAHARDLCTSLLAIRHPDTTARIGRLARATSLACSVSKDLPRTVSVVLGERGIDPWPHLDTPLIPSHRIDQGVSWGDLQPPVGTGPYRAIEDGRRWRFTSYPRTLLAPLIRTLHRDHTSLGHAHTDALLSGGVAAVIEVPPDDLPRIRQQSGITLRYYDRQRLTGLLLNTAHGTMSEASNRSRLHHSLDRGPLRAEVIGTDPDRSSQTCMLVTGPYGQDDARYNHAVPHVLEPAPWGAEPTPLALGVYAGTDDQVKLTAAVSRSLRRSGFDVHVTVLDGKTWFNEVLEGARPDEFDALLTTFNLEEEIGPWLHSRSHRQGLLQPFSAGHLAVDLALDELRHSPDGVAASRNLHAVLANHHVLIPLWEKDTWTAWANGRAEHLPLSPGDYFGHITRWTKPTSDPPAR